ncbi:MAG: bottromycin family RiPP peptide [Pseudonocardiales bacterium]
MGPLVVFDCMTADFLNDDPNNAELSALELRELESWGTWSDETDTTALRKSRSDSC